MARWEMIVNAVLILGVLISYLVYRYARNKRLSNPEYKERQKEMMREEKRQQEADDMLDDYLTDANEDLDE